MPTSSGCGGNEEGTYRLWIDGIGLHYVGVRPDAGPYESHRVRYGGFRLRSLAEKG